MGNWLIPTPIRGSLIGQILRLMGLVSDALMDTPRSAQVVRTLLLEKWRHLSYDRVLSSTEVLQNYESAFLQVTGYDAVSDLGAAVVVDDDGDFSYSPGTSFDYLKAGESLVDTFEYQVSDVFGATAIETVQITVNGENDAPESPGNIIISGNEDLFPSDH